MVIDQHRAHERVQYDKLSEMVRESKVVAQQLLLPEVIDVSVEDACIVEEISEELKMVGLNVEYNSEAGQLLVKSIPSLIETSDVHGIIESLLYDFRNGEVNVSGGIQEYITRVLAKRSAMSYGKTLTADEMSRLYDKLFLSDSPSISPMGKTIFTIISYSDIESLLV
jgi:DNA mismatch repair protein MutL